MTLDFGQTCQKWSKKGPKSDPDPGPGRIRVSQEVLGRFWTYFGSFARFRGSPVYLTGYGHIEGLGQDQVWTQGGLGG